MASKKKIVRPPKGKVLLTQEGHDKLNRELAQLINERRPYVVVRIQRAREMENRMSLP